MAKKKKKKRKIFFVLKLMILITLLSVLIGGTVLYFMYGKEVFAMQEQAIQLVADSTADTFRTSETSLAYNSDGKQVAVLKGEKDSYYLTFDKIPQWAKDAMIVTEDRKFYEHNGIDIKGITRAAWELLIHKGAITQGASTITQQVAENVFLTHKRNYALKVKEIFLALELEKKYTKQQILEFYLNNIYFANGYYGIEAAAKGYFSKSSKDLTLGQICFLCSIPNNPNLYNPVRKMKNTIIRKNRILDQMLAEKVISAADYDTAYHEKITLKIQEVKTRNFIQTFITRCATRSIMTKNGFEFNNQFSSEADESNYEEQYDEAYAAAQKEIFNGGYRIYTSIDLEMQKKMQKAVNANLASFKTKNKDGIYKMQGAATCIDNKDGRVVAIVGGRSQDDLGYTLNRAYQSYRQPGSSIKPLIVYTPAFENGYTPNTIVDDHKIKDGPANSSGGYSGKIPLYYAVEQSKNTVAWQIFKKLTPKVGLEYLFRMNFARIVDSDYYLPASLGGLTYGCSTLEMASGYATLANQGKYRDPTCIVKITDSSDNVIVEDDVDEKYIYDATAASTMVEVLKGVIKKGTAVGLALDNQMPCAGKTGTTNDKKDGWFCGFTPYYTTSVWIGYDQPKTVPDLYGATYPGKTWYAFMNQIHKGLAKKEFVGKAMKIEKNTASTNNTNISEKPTATKKPTTKATPTPTKKAVKTEEPTTGEGLDTTETPDDANYSEDNTTYNEDTGN